MAFEAKTDYFGLGDNSTLKVSDAADGKTASEATAMGEDGSIIASTVYGETLNPSNTYKLKANITGTKNVVLGSVTGTTEKIALASVSITTGADVEPTVQASGTQVHTGATSGCTYTVNIAGLTTKRHAQRLFGITATITGDAKLTAANYTVEGAIGKATVNGECVAFDITQGKITAQLTMVQHGSTAPSAVALGQDWIVTAPLACSSPDASYPTWSLTAVKYLAKDVVSP